MPAGEPMKSCRWKCGRPTKNNTGICDACWRDRDRIYFERKQREAAEGKNPNRIAGGKRARISARGLDLLQAGLSRLG